MPFSMTGYGRYSTEDALYKTTVEIRSLNHRFLDISVRLPSPYLWLEVECTQALKEFFRRGKIEARIQLEPKPEASAPEVVLMDDLVRQYLDRLKAKTFPVGRALTGRTSLKDSRGFSWLNRKR